MKFFTKRKIIPLAALLAIVALLVPIPVSSTKFEDIPHETTYKTDSKLELGDEKVDKPGADGGKKINYRGYQSLLFYLLDVEVDRKEVGSQVLFEPVDKVVVKGSKRWQYMLCTDGTYRSYTDNQMKNPQAGFTSKSPDDCKESGHGKKRQLVDSPHLNVQQSQQSRQLPTVTGDVSGYDCKNITTPYKTKKVYDETMFQGETWTQSSGMNGERFECSNGYVGYNFPVEDEVIRVGTRPRSEAGGGSRQPNASAKAVCESNYNSALAQLRAAGATGSSAMSQLNALHAQCLRDAGY